MKLSNLNLLELPYVNLTQLKKLPTSSAIYFAIDSEDRVLYVGLSINLAERWKAHHRLQQLKEIDQENSIKIAWLIWTKEDLNIVEKYFIDRYQPLLNGTKVKYPKVIPSETALRELLARIRLLTIVIGIQPATNHQLATVYLKFDYENSGKNGCAKVIKQFKEENIYKKSNLKIKRTRYGEYRTYNTRPGSREHKQISRIKSSYNNHWEIPCNGIVIDITPINNHEFTFLRSRDSSKWIKLAGIKIRAINFQDSHLSVLHSDPIPLLWIDKK